MHDVVELWKQIAHEFHNKERRYVYIVCEREVREIVREVREIVRE